MRYPVTIGLAAMLAGFSIFGFWRTHVVEDSELGAFVPRMEAQVADWEAKKVPAASRVFNLVLSDAGSGTEPLLVSAEPGLSDRVSAWFSRTFLPRKAVPASQFAQAFADEPNTLVWTHEGFATASEGQMMRELAKAIVTAHDAGAEVNIVAQGVSAGPVISALASLEHVQRKGLQVGVNKVVLVGMDMPRLKRIPSIKAYDFMRLGNVIELANIWVPHEEYAKQTMMQVFARGKEGRKFPVEEVWPQLAGHSTSLADMLPLLRQLVAKVAAMEQIIAQQEQTLREAEARKAADEAAKTQAAAQKAAQEAAKTEAAAQKAADVAAKKEAAAQKAAEAAAKKQGRRPAGAAPQGASDGQKGCAQCCADVGGSWSWGSETGGDSDVQSAQAKWGCCNGADYNSSVPSCRAAGRFGFNSFGFRCARQ
jgi:hypothetical protein